MENMAGICGLTRRAYYLLTDVRPMQRLHTMPAMSYFPTSAAPGCSMSELSALMLQLRSGDRTALWRLYDATVGNVYSRVLRVTGNVADAERVTCDVYGQLWHHAQSLGPEQNALQWLMDVARSRSLDFATKRITGRESTPVSPGHCADAIRSALDGLLRQTQFNPDFAELDGLSPLQARVLGLFFFEGLSYPEISSCTNMSPALVHASLCETLLSVRQALVGTRHIAMPLDGRPASNAAQARTDKRSEAGSEAGG